MALKQNFYLRSVKKIARIFFPRAKTVYEEEPGDDACILVCNHAGIRGPVMVTLDYIRPHRPWAIDCAMNRDKAVNYAYHDVFVGRSRKNKPFWYAASHFVALALPPLLREADALSVHHDQSIISTFKQSISTLKEGKDIVIFAESPVKFSEYVNDLQSGFADLAPLYYRLTGKKLKFYPCYLEKKCRILAVGKPIEFDPDLPIDEMREKVATYVRDSIDRLGRSLPKHKPVSFLPERWYRAYGEYVEDQPAYWNLLDQGKDRKIIK